MPNIKMPGPRDDDKVNLSCKLSAFLFVGFFKLWARFQR